MVNKSEGILTLNVSQVSPLIFCLCSAIDVVLPSTNVIDEVSALSVGTSLFESPFTKFDAATVQAFCAARTVTMVLKFSVPPSTLPDTEYTPTGTLLSVTLPFVTTPVTELPPLFGVNIRVAPLRFIPSFPFTVTSTLPCVTPGTLVLICISVAPLYTKEYPPRFPLPHFRLYTRRITYNLSTLR